MPPKIPKEKTKEIFNHLSGISTQLTDMQTKMRDDSSQFTKTDWEDYFNPFVESSKMGYEVMGDTFRVFGQPDEKLSKLIETQLDQIGEHLSLIFDQLVAS